MAMPYTWLTLIILVVPLIHNKRAAVARIIPVEDLVESEEIGSLLDRQIAQDIIYDLADRKMLVTKDELTDEYHTFMVDTDKDGFPYVRDPETGHKYLVKYSRIRKGVDLYKITVNRQGTPLVADWATMTVNNIKLNQYGEVELVPVKQGETAYKFGQLALKAQ